MMTNIVYTAWFLDNPDDLLSRVDVVLQGPELKLYAHHVTIEYMPTYGIDTIVLGKHDTLQAYGQVFSSNVQAVLVRSTRSKSISTKKYPHITLATANGARPNDSNNLIEQSFQNNTVQYFNEPFDINVTQGYFDGKSVVTI